MVAPVHNFDPKILLEGSSKLRWAGRGPSVCMWSNGKKKAFDVGGPSSIDFIYFWGSNEKQRSCDGRGGGARSALFAWQWAQKDGCAQRTGAHARPKPTSLIIIIYEKMIHSCSHFTYHIYCMLTIKVWIMCNTAIFRGCDRVVT